MIFLSKVRIEFLSFSLPCLVVCLIVCWVVFVYLFVCLDFWKVRIEFLPFFLPCDFFCEGGSKNRVLTFSLTLRIFLKSKNWVLIFFPYLVIFFFKSKNYVLTFCLTMFVCLFVCWVVFVCLFVFLKSKNWVLTFCLACDFFPKVRIAFLPFSLPLDFFLKSKNQVLHFCKVRLFGKARILTFCLALNCASAANISDETWNGFKW